MNEDVFERSNGGDVSDLVRLARWSTPTISNALEALGVDPGWGFSDRSMGLLTEGLPAFAGRAVTVKVVTATRRDPSDKRHIPTESYWSYVAAEPGPKIVVSQDLDRDPVGAMWGEVQGRLHRSLGVVGIITNGAVRDVDELKRIPLPVIAGRTCVSHAYARFVEVNVPVAVGGLEITPGDLVHADRHGVQLIPGNISLEGVSRVAREIDLLEAELFAAANQSKNGLADFLPTWDAVQSRWPRATASQAVP